MTITASGVREAVSNAGWGQWTQADYSPEQWRRACLVDMGTGDPGNKNRYKVPVREPDGTLNRNGCHAAAGAHGLQGVDAPPDVKRTAARALVRLYTSQLKESAPAAILTMAGMSANSADPGGVTRDLTVVNIDVDLEDEDEDEDEEDDGECGCEVDSVAPCADCGCCCAGDASGNCGCACGADGTCGTCGCSCNDPQAEGASTAPGGMNACAPKGKGKKAGMHAKYPGGFTRTIAFRLASTKGDGRTLEGYAAVFDSPTRIDSMFEGKFDEQIRRGAFARYLEKRTPTLMFEHGHHPLIGSMPLGRITRASEDTRGLYVQARLSDNWLIEPVRDAVRDGAITGMSFRFLVPEGGDTWEKRKGDVPLRTLTDVDVPELGPVVFPAYEPTTVSVRSSLDRIPKTLSGRSTTRRGEGGGRDDRTRQRTAALTYEEIRAIQEIEIRSNLERRW
jgi:HK97 family phage prohead protease